MNETMNDKMNDKKNKESVRDYDLEMARYIWDILKSNPVVLMSWGIDPKTIRTVNLGLEFHVQGFRHTGKVRITLDEGKDLFVVTLIPDSEEKTEIIEDVYLDMLVSVIDEHVEKTEDYEKRICEEYRIIRYPLK